MATIIVSLFGTFMVVDAATDLKEAAPEVYQQVDRESSDSSTVGVTILPPDYEPPKSTGKAGIVIDIK